MEDPLNQQRAKDAYSATLTVTWGELTLQALKLPVQGASTVTVTRNGEAVGATASSEGEITFVTPLTVGSSQVLQYTQIEDE